MRALRVPRPRILQPHTGNHVTPPEPWPTEFDVELARRKARRFIVLDPGAVPATISRAQLVVMYEQQHQAAVVLAAALDREGAR